MPPLHLAWIGIGSNLGDRLSNCRWGVERLKLGTSIRILNTSSFYKTEPHTLRGERVPWYVNGAVAIETSLPPEALQRHLHQIETESGRRRGFSWRPRTLDLDILLYDQLALKTPALTIPHLQIPHRRFVLVPLAEIAPTVIHPTLNKTIAGLLQESMDSAKVRPL